MRTLLIDNYDSFTHILADRISPYVGPLTILRNNSEKLRSLFNTGLEKDFDLIILSPGPKTPKESGLCFEALASKLPALGICLGMQIINEYHGGETIPSIRPTHGQAVSVQLDNKTQLGRLLAETIPGELSGMRYNSLACKLSRGTELVAKEKPEFFSNVHVEGEAMIIINGKHLGIQFHPESFLSPKGSDLLRICIEHIKNNI